jgi:hypothetical protein
VGIEGGEKRTGWWHWLRAPAAQTEGAPKPTRSHPFQEMYCNDWSDDVTDSSWWIPVAYKSSVS